MKTISAILFSLLLCIGAMGQVPAITMTTTLPIGSRISLTLGCKMQTTIQIDFGDGNLVNKNIDNYSLFTFFGFLAGSQTVKIYGSGINYLFCYENQLTFLDVSNCPDLVQLDCNGNKLTSLDVTKNKALYRLFCYNNAITKLDVTQNSALSQLDCNHNQINILDLANNTILTELVCSSNLIRSLDVSLNLSITYIDCRHCKIKTLNLGPNKVLAKLDCGDNALNSLNVTQNTALTKLYCGDNQLKTLDITNNKALTEISCYNNQLQTLDVSKNSVLTSISITRNLFTYTTLPLPKVSWKTYSNKPQKPIPIANNVEINTPIDLSNQLTINGNTTVYTWKTKFKVTLSPITDYSISNGRTTFLKPQPDSVYCELTNSTFPDFSAADVLKTTCAKVLEKPVMSMTTTKPVGSTVILGLAASANNTPVTVDFGNGNWVSMNISDIKTGGFTPIKGTLANSQTINIYGSGISHLSADDCQLSSLDISRNNDLTQMWIGKNLLSSLNLSSNPNLLLLDCHNNLLRSIDVSNNKLLSVFNCSNNQLEVLDISNNANLRYLTCSDNLLTQILTGNASNIADITCDNNNLTFATLPPKLPLQAAPQKPIPIVRNIWTGIELDLSNQYLINGQTTIYTWKIKSGTTLNEGSDYTISGGITVFKEPQTDSVYCEMKNILFPDFTGSGVLKTICTKVQQVPVMSMTTLMPEGSVISFYLTCGVSNNTVLIDFGNGKLVPKLIGTSRTMVTGTLTNSQTIKIYGENIYQLICDHMQLVSLDVSKNSKLNYLVCSNNQLTRLDISKNTELYYVVCSFNQLDNFNVTQNTMLYTLGCDENNLSDLDLSKNTALHELICSNNKLSSLDVSKNASLSLFYCDNNKLITLDVSKNPKLYRFACSNNILTTINVSNTLLYSLACSNNLFTFASLPLKQSNWDYFVYAPQNLISITKSIAVGAEADLSSQLTINGNTTVYAWKTKGGTILSTGTDYTITSGKTVFLKSQSDSVYCEMTNATFPNFYGSNALKTTNIKIMAQPIIGMANSTVNEPLAFAASSQALTEAPKPEPEKEVEPQLTAYPNPVTDILYLKGDETENTHVSIFNQSGTKVWSGIVSQQSINIAQLPAGIYMLKVYNKDKETQTIRFVKQ